MTHEMNGWVFPDEIQPSESWFYRMKFDGREVYDLNVDGCISLIHQADDLGGVETEIVASGVDDDGIRYAAAVVTIMVDGHSYSAVGGADAASQQVRDPEHVWSVASSRAFKRAVKKAFGLVESSGAQPDRNQTGDLPIDHPAMTEPVEVEPSPEPEPDPQERTISGIEGDEELDW